VITQNLQKCFILQNLAKHFQNLFRFVLSAIIFLHSDGYFATDSQLFIQRVFRADATPVVSMMQRPLYAQSVKHRAVFRQFSTLKIIDEADCRKHKWIAREIADVWMTLKSRDDCIAFFGALASCFIFRIVLRKTDRRTPVPRVFCNLRLSEILQITFSEFQFMQSAWWIPDRP